VLHWLRHLLHRLIHRLGWQHGHVVSRWHDGWLEIGFRCAKCREVTHVHRSHIEGRTVGPDTPWSE
jgi:hypothetical protein